ncbi:uncharacterized protein BX663DRAFT_20475 [Cokeromyces recurvatus]|uniref:uncharacterized protein n=1 Tax=Cokeromyces recurvatus TaxID=90255 RepID=UPI00221E66A0|nr:uncharacterized protein BX663DRAFT_20475 [Cokeromyces recurvatus]KAI7908111.1 hypothetical protein BX663DRAFT_20475 [Cokeromyces recurvatus]
MSTSKLNKIEKDGNPSNIKVVEARQAVLLLKGYSARNESTMWFLEHMFRPLTLNTYDNYQLLYLSPNIKPFWEKKKDSRQVQTELISHEMSTDEDPSKSLLNHDMASENDKMYIITPRTRILTVAKEHNFVFMIDLSSSLATIDTNSGKVMIGHTFNIIKNIIQGLIKPFSLDPNDVSSPFIIDCIVRITVIAECSQFGSNINVIPILAEYSTIRVLLQNTIVSIDNISTVLNVLKDAIEAFKKDLGTFRKNLTIKRSKMGYELDVRDDHTPTVTENTDLNFNLNKSSHSSSNVSLKQTQQSRKNSLNLSKYDNTSAHIVSDNNHSKSESVSNNKYQQNKRTDNSFNNKKTTETSHHYRHHHSRYHKHKHSSSISDSIESVPSNVKSPIRQSIVKDGKDVWGVGKTGTVISYISD